MFRKSGASQSSGAASALPTYANSTSQAAREWEHGARVICLALVALLITAACAPTPAASAISGRLLVWHSYENIAADSLERAFARFSNIYPELAIISVYVPPDQLYARYTEAAAQALGPDLLIGEHHWISDFADEAFIREISGFAPNLERYLSSAVETVRYRGGIYGLPFALSPVALYYNRTLVEQPPTQIDELTAEAAAGRAVGLLTRFERAFWGVSAFGGQLFDENGALVLDRGGFASWLTWLKTAQDSPGFFISSDTEALRALFAQGVITYYIGTPVDLDFLRNTIGAEAVGVALLPAGPGGAAAPLLYTHVLMFNRASSQRAQTAAFALAEFLTNNEQSAAFVREFQHVPANRNVRIDAGVNPVVAAFSAQARNAIPVTNTRVFDLLLQQGDSIYARVLDGVISAGEAAAELTTTINTALDLTPADPMDCVLAGEIVLWHTWVDASAAYLRAVSDAFMRDCPTVTVSLVPFSTDSAIAQSYTALAGQPFAPHMLLINSDFVYPLASQGLIRSISGELTQSFIPTAVESVRYQGRVYGLPLSLNVSALYYNAQQVSDPAVSINALLNGTDRAALPITFVDAYWGASALGAFLFDQEGRLLLDRGGLSAWLALLQSARADERAIVGTARGVLENQFVTGEAAYYIAPPDAYPRLAERMGANAIRVTTLPSGTNPALPILRTTAFVFTAPTPAESANPPAELYLRFAAYMTSVEAQAALLENTPRIPTHVNLPVPEGSPEQVFRAQARQAITLPNIAQRAALLENADALLRAVIIEGADPVATVAAFVAAVNEANQISAQALPLAADEPTPELTPELMPAAIPDVTAEAGAN